MRVPSERERAIEAFQTKEFIDFALSSAQTAQQISNKEEELRAEEEMLNHEKHIITSCRKFGRSSKPSVVM
jgi:hypothetical protein